MPASIACMFFAFAMTSVVALVHKRFNTPTWVIGVLTPVFVGIYALAMLAMPFHGIVAEFPLVILATLAGSGPVVAMHRLNERIAAERKAKSEQGHAVEFRGADGGLAANAWVATEDVRATCDVDIATLSHEDLILYKGLARRDKDRTAIVAIAKRQDLDRAYIESWARRLGIWRFVSSDLKSSR